MNIAKKVAQCFSFYFTNIDCTEDNMDYKGLDLRYHITDAYEQCQDKCSSDPSCQFWTWVKKTETPKSFNCFLKDLISNRTANELTVSGLRNCNGKQAENMFSYVADI